MSIFSENKFDLDNPQVVAAIDDLPLWSAPFGMKLLDTVELKKNITVLDIGSGMGFPLIELSQRLGETCKLYGIDPWNAAAERTRDKINIWKINNVEVIEAKAENLTFGDNHFDLIISNNGINNVENETQVISELSRVAKPNAQLVLTVNLPDSMIEFYNIFENVLNKNDKSDKIKSIKKHIYSKRKPIDFTVKLIENSGFKIKNIYKDSFDLRFVDGSALFNHYFIRIAFLKSWIEIIDPPDVTKIFQSLEMELNKLANKNGEIKLTIPWVCFDCRKI